MLPRWRMIPLVAVCAALAVTGCGKTGENGGGKSPAGSKTTQAGGGGGPQDDGSPIPEGWGDLKVKFVYDGTPPQPQELKLTADVPYCSQHAPVDETVVAGPNGELANVVVWLRPSSGEEVKINEDYQKLVDQPVELSNNKCRFQPHVTAMWNKRPLLVLNEDEVAHNTKADLLVNDSFNVQIPPGQKIERKFDKEEPLPGKVSCGAHPWMQGRLIIRDNPYLAVSDKDGVAVIKNLPTGRWNFQFWQEGVGYVQQVEWDGKKANWKKGVQKLAIRPGENDIGVVKVGGFR